MEVIHRRTLWRALITPVLVAALALGYLAFAHRSSSPVRQHGAPPAQQLSASDLLAIVAKAKAGITMSYDGVTAPSETMDVHSFQFGVGRGIGSPSSPGGRNPSAPNVSEAVVTHTTDQFSTKLFKESLNGTGADVHVFFTDAKNKPNPIYLEFHLENTLISGFSMSSGGDRPQESISLNFTKITMTARIGTEHSVSYDLATNTVLG